MAYLTKRKDGRFEIREAVSTEKGPRSRTLASFRGVLAPEVLERAGRRASRPFDPEALVARAVGLGIPVTRRREDRPARELLAALRRGASIDPVLVGLLKSALEASPAAEAPARLAEVVEWIGRGEARRGEALRGLLRLYDRVVRSRGRVRARRKPPFPRFSSEPQEAA